MKLDQLVRLDTPSNNSPAIYKSDRGTYLIQGYKIPSEYRDRVRDLVDNEDVVEIPARLIEAIKEL